MAIVSFEPVFDHQEWVDNVDRVTAGGPNGFNARFNAIVADLNQITQVVQKVDNALERRPASNQLIQTNVTIPAFSVGPPQTGGVADVPLGALLPVNSHVFHQISVRPDVAHLNVQVTWTEVAFVADTGAGAPPLLARMLRLQHRNPSPVTVNVRVLRLEVAG